MKSVTLEGDSSLTGSNTAEPTSQAKGVASVVQVSCTMASNVCLWLHNKLYASMISLIRGIICIFIELFMFSVVCHHLILMCVIGNLSRNHYN